jgi:hypothetical protein
MPKHEGQQACKQTGLSNSFSSKQKLIEVFKEAATVTSNVLSFETVAWLLVGHLTLMCVLLLPLPPPPLTAAARWLPPSLREAELLAPTTSTQLAFLELKLGSVRGQR